MTEQRLLSLRGEAEKVWRQLCKDDQIVVLADGLEEALTEGNAGTRTVTISSGPPFIEPASYGCR